MKASIIYTVAVSVVLISTLEIRLEKNHLSSVGSRQDIKMNSVFKSNENKKGMVDYAKVALTKYNSDDKKKGTLVLAKPELVLEETPVVCNFTPTNYRIWSYESAIIEENEIEQVQNLNDYEESTFSTTDELIEVPFLCKKETSFETIVRLENTIIDETEVNETNSLDFNWIDTLAMFDEVIVVPSKTTVDETIDFSVVGEDTVLLEQPLDYKWIETLQIFDEPIMTPPHILTEKNLVITDYLNDAIIESNQYVEK